MQPIHGKDVLVSLKIDEIFRPVLCATDMSFNCTQELVLATSADTGKWRKKRLRGLSEWSVSVNGLSKIGNNDGQVSFFYLLQENIRGTEQIIQMMFEDEDGNTQVLEGTVVIPSLSINGNVNSFADASVLFEGAGSVDIVEPVSDVESGVCEELESDTFTLAEGATFVSGVGQEGKSFAGKEILEVDREGSQYDYADGSPGNRQYAYNGTNISFESAGNPGGETVFVMWKQ
jgi:predicted secreted protein